jgi:5-methylcytosine-specific restriction endonuclease McrA
MKICWDNIENIIYHKGKWYKGKNLFIYIEGCKNCGEPFLGRDMNSEFCSRECKSSYINSGRKHSKETKKKIGEKSRGRKHTEETKRKIREYNIGRKHTEETKKKISESQKGIPKAKRSKEHKHNLSLSKKGKYIGDKSNGWKGGYHTKGLPLYDTYASQIEWAEEVRRSSKDENILEVKCAYCGKWYVPSLSSLWNRLEYLKGNYKNELRLYCSEHCKSVCPLYNKTPEALMKEDAVRAGRLGWLELNREVQLELRQMVLKRDEYECVKCGSEGSLHCHHILPVAINPLLSADVDNCITLCEKCHKEVHKQDDCRYEQIRMEIC